MNLSVKFGPNIFPACVPGPDYIYPIVKQVTTIGWGLVGSDPMQSATTLQEADIFLYPDNFCGKFLDVGCKNGNLLAI